MTLSFEMWKVAVGKLRKRQPWLRKGQAHFTCLPTWIYNKLHSSEFDCFYQDDRFDQFIKRVEELWGRHDDIAGIPGHEVITSENPIYDI